MKISNDDIIEKMLNIHFQTEMDRAHFSELFHSRNVNTGNLTLFQFIKCSKLKFVNKTCVK